MSSPDMLTHEMSLHEIVRNDMACHHMNTRVRVGTTRHQTHAVTYKSNLLWAARSTWVLKLWKLWAYNKKNKSLNSKYLNIQRSLVSFVTPLKPLRTSSPFAMMQSHAKAEQIRRLLYKSPRPPSSLGGVSGPPNIFPPILARSVSLCGPT